MYGTSLRLSFPPQFSTTGLLMWQLLCTSSCQGKSCCNSPEFDCLQRCLFHMLSRYFQCCWRASPSPPAGEMNFPPLFNTISRSLSLALSPVADILFFPAESDCTPDACSDPTITDLTQCVGTFFDGTATVPRQAIVVAGPGCIFPPGKKGTIPCPFRYCSPFRPPPGCTRVIQKSLDS